MKSKHEIKICPRCGVTFECKVNNPVHCQCAGVALSRELSERISERYRDCLCVDCLKAISLKPDSLRDGG
jgi:hypothetical protein